MRIARTNAHLYSNRPSYRPPSGPEGRVGADAGSPHGPYAPWTIRDTIGAIIVGFSLFVYVAFAGALVDAIQEDDGSATLSYLVSALVLLTMAAGVGKLSGLRLTALGGVVALATGIVVAVRFIAGSGENELVGVPLAFIDSAVSSAMFAATVWLFWRAKYHAPASSVGLVAPASPVAYLIAVAAWVGALVLIGLWGALVELLEFLEPPENAAEALERAGGSIVPAWLLVGLFVPFAEELFFRGFLLTGLLQRLKAPLALLLSAAIFALFHIEPGLYVPTFVLGLALGWVYLRTRSLWPSIFLHALQNSLAIIVTWQGTNTPV